MKKKICLNNKFLTGEIFFGWKFLKNLLGPLVFLGGFYLICLGVLKFNPQKKTGENRKEIFLSSFFFFIEFEGFYPNFFFFFSIFFKEKGVLA